MTKEYLENLYKHVHNLHKLLEDVQISHFSWIKAVSDEWKAIAESWSKPEEASIFLIEYEFKDKWYISCSNNHSFFVSYDDAQLFIKNHKDTIPTLSIMPTRIKGYARTLETENGK